MMSELEVSEITQKLMDIWKEALCIETLNVEDSLFDIGGNSLVAMMILHEIEQEFNIPIEISGLLELNTIHKQVEKIEQEMKKKYKF